MRRHIFNKRAAQGSVTIFLIIIMLPMLIFSCSVIDICKIFMARNSTDGALNIAMNSRLASYDDILKDMYGILASSANEDELSKKLTEYYKLTLESSTGTTLDKDSEKYVENFFTNLFQTDMSKLDSSVEGTNGLLNLFEDSGAEFSVTPIATSSVSNPEVMHKQIVEYMKYRGPVYLASGVLDKIMAFSDVSNQAKAAQAQIDFDKQLEKTGSAFKEAYDNLRDLLAEGERLEKEVNFSECYKADNLIVPQEDFVKYTYLYSLPPAYICTYFGEALAKNSGTLKLLSAAEDAFDADFNSSDEISDAADNLEDMLKELGDIKEDAEEAQKIFGSNDIGLNFIKNNSEKTISDKILKLLNTFGILFEDCEYSDNNDLVWLLRAYNDARSYSNYLDEELGKKQSDEKKKELNDKKDEVDSALDKAEPVVRKIKSAAEEISDFMGYEYDAAKRSFEGEIKKLKTTYEIVKAQIERLEALLGSGAGSIDNIVEQLKKAGELGKKTEDAIDKVNSPSEKAGMMEVYNSQADLVEEVTEKSNDETDKLKEILSTLRDVYKAEKGAIESMDFLCDANYSSSNPIVKNNTVRTSFNDYLKEFSKAHTNKPAKEWYSLNDFYNHFYKNFFENVGFSTSTQNYFIYMYIDLFNDLDDSLFFSHSYERGINLEKWDAKNENIKNNKFYILVKENGDDREDSDKSEEEEKAKSQAESTQGDIENFGKEVQSKNKDGSSKEDKNTDETDKDWFIPKAYPTFMAYVSDLEKAFSANDGTNEILNELNEKSFSFEESEDKSVLSNKSFEGDLADGASNALGAIGDFFANLLTATRDNFYIAEYLTENFPCVTTLQGSKKDTAQMISGEYFYKDGKPGVVCAHSSLEYILYGDMNGGAGEAANSVVKASAVLFGVRFVFNFIYALTSADLAGQIEPIIAPLEAIPFAGPIIRIVILIGLALGESALDVGFLLAGQSVALYKTPGTWICSPMGFIKNGGEALLNTAIDTAVDETTKALTKAEDDLAKSLSDGVEATADQIDEYTKQLLESMKKEVEENVFNPITNTIKDVVEDFDRNQVKPKLDDVKKKIGDAISEARENLKIDENSSDDILNNIRYEIFNYLDTQIDSIANTIYSQLDAFHDKAKTAILGEIDSFNKLIRTKFDNIVQKIDSTVKSKTDALRDKVKEAIGEVSADLKGKTIKMGEDIKTKLKTKVNSKVRGTKPAASKVNLSKSSNEGLITEKESDAKAEKTLKVTYEDYMYVFTVIGLCFNENNMLMRASQLINANVELRISGEVRKESPQNAFNSDTTYNLNKAYTLFKGEAGSKTRTMFLGTTWNKENQQWILPASNVYSYKATTYVGY
ncbi:MAG: DUF5702 domain-containing protein [Oscillospiraceae bacterium]